MKEYVLKSGVAVSIRPQTWDGYWRQVEFQAQAEANAERMEEEGALASEIALQRLRDGRAALEMVLEECVDGWGSLGLSVADVNEISEIIARISKDGVESGN